MNYQETLDYMYQQLPMYQRIGNAAFKKDLTNISELCKALGNPQARFKSIHVAGTNGKGSSSHYIAAILQKAGHKVGLYTSPHLKSFTERIRINGEEISQESVIEFVGRLQPLLEKIQPSFFEMSVAMAFHYFAKESVDYAVIEVGLGGRLDSTNILTPEACLITNIGYDHQSLLGNTLPEIAAEKAGIIKPRTPIVISEKQEMVSEIFRKKAEEVGAPISFAERYWTVTKDGKIKQQGITKIPHIEIPLLGEHQRKNIQGALQLTSLLGISLNAMWEGIEQVKELTGLKGRWQQLGEKPTVICDVGHNIDGIRAVLKQIEQYQYEQLHIVWGMSNDKDRKPIYALMPKDAVYYCCKADVPRGMDASMLAAEMKEEGLEAVAYASVANAVDEAKKASGEQDFIYIGGSIFVVAEIEDL